MVEFSPNGKAALGTGASRGIGPSRLLYAGGGVLACIGRQPAGD